MFEGFWGLLLFALASAILLIPFGVAAIYFYLSLRQVFIGSKENNSWKLKGGIMPLIISAIVLGIIAFLWLYLWVL